MSEYIEGSALDLLDKSLRATNVISPDFRKHIMWSALKCSEEGYQRGKEAANPPGEPCKVPGCPGWA